MTQKVSEQLNKYIRCVWLIIKHKQLSSWKKNKPNTFAQTVQYSASMQHTLFKFNSVNHYQENSCDYVAHFHCSWYLVHTVYYDKNMFLCFSSRLKEPQTKLTGMAGLTNEHNVLHSFWTIAQISD